MVLSRLHDQVGRVLGGRYRLIAPIGTGASAMVFLADDARLRRRVAVKVLHQALSGDEAFLRRFRAEAQSAAALSHPHIVAVYDWGEDEHEPYLVTEYLGGGSLRAVLDQGRRLSVSQALLVGLEASRALDFAHKRGFVHRDIKPANLLFGEEGRLRIADFGLARALAEAAWTEPAGAMVGTARYACPEQARGEKVDGRGDVYSLALVLIEAVTGSVPFAGDTTIATLMARIDKPVPVPEAMGQLRKVLERAGRPDPDERPDAGELGVALLAAAEDLPRPEPLPLVGATATLAELTVVDRDPTMMPPPVPASTPAADGPATAADVEPPASPPDDEPKRRRRWPYALLVVLLLAALGTGGALAYNALRVVTHTLPDLTALDKDPALARISANRWKAVVREDRRDGTRAGQVIAQDPAPGTKLAEDKPVTITVSLGNTLVAVPAFDPGTAQSDVEAAITAAGLTVGTVSTAHDENLKAGTLITLDPSTPPQLAKGEAVSFTVSDGPAPRVVPAIAAGTPYDQAVAALTNVQLKAARSEEFSDDITAGAVIRIDPSAGSAVARDSTVAVVVSKGPPQIPDVKGLAVADAADKLQAAGYTVSGVDGNPFRTVTGTNPPAGSQAKTGSAVVLITR